ncbi:ABC transporter permease subunit [Bacillus sp. UNC437CL72CviS29]|uniref:ABC transporter permease subunit n=1 Tax=Bacillus sp. UNC437CL72CviS29 TaxID=1340430 RepID=UPI00047D9C41|nr:ABC transporter permease subunit [Bacillus sp. UNC437CL72CviS29]
MWTIAKLSFKEILLKRIFTITLCMTFVFLIFYGVAIHYAVSEILPGKSSGISAAQDFMGKSFFSTQLLGVGLYFSSFITALLAILSSVGSIANEIESHQIDTWLTRPISRFSFLMGKWIGLCLLLIAYAAFLFISIVLIHQTMGGSAFHLDFTATQIIKALALFLIQPVILISIAILLSTRMATLNAGIVLIILYGTGFIGGFVEQIGTLAQKTALVNMGIIASLLFPIDTMYRKMTIYLFDSGDNPLSIASQGVFGSVSAPSNMMIVYVVLYVLAAIFIAIRTFKSRDL